jgi:hypothetical protein
LGDTYRYHARWAEAAGHYERGLAEARAQADEGLVRLFETELALVDGWTGVDPRLRQPTDMADGEPWTQVGRLIAAALFKADTQPNDARTELDLAAEMASTFGLAEGTADVLVARAFLAAVEQDDDSLRDAHAQLREYVSQTATYASWLQVIETWSGQVRDSSYQVQWIKPSTSLAAWQRVVAERRVRKPSRHEP